MYLHVGSKFFRVADVWKINLDAGVQGLRAESVPSRVADPAGCVDVYLTHARGPGGESEATRFRGVAAASLRAWALGEITGLVRDVPGLGPVRDLEPPAIEDGRHHDVPLNIPDGPMEIPD